MKKQLTHQEKKALAKHIEPALTNIIKIFSLAGDYLMYCVNYHTKEKIRVETLKQKGDTEAKVDYDFYKNPVFITKFVNKTNLLTKKEKTQIKTAIKKAQKRNDEKTTQENNKK